MASWPVFGGVGSGGPDSTAVRSHEATNLQPIKTLPKCGNDRCVRFTILTGACESKFMCLKRGVMKNKELMKSVKHLYLLPSDPAITEINHRSTWFAIPLAVALSLGTLCAPDACAQGSSSAPKSYEPASVRALPGLQCQLHTAGSAATEGVRVFTNGDGYARFYAVRTTANDAARRLALNCKDSAGKTTSYTVDLASEDTFAPRSIDLSKEPGTDRPALKGNPLSYTEAQLIEAGYGVRPDPSKSAAAYARWLDAASKPARLLGDKRPLLHKHGPNVTTSSDGLWTGSVLTGLPEYSLVEATFNVPTGIPSGDGTTDTVVSVWVGVGGGTGQVGLMQDGIDVWTTPTTASYNSFQEYCCGDANQTSGGGFSPNPGDQLYAQAWYCDATGNRNINGGYGCAFVQDLTSTATLSCTSATGSPCASVKANALCSVSPTTPNCFVLGPSADFIIENDSPQAHPPSTAFTDFTPKVTMAGSAFSTQTNTLSQTISNDPIITVLTDWTKDGTHMLVALGTKDETYFWIEPRQPSYPLYCQGPLSTSPAPNSLTQFKWASQGAGANSPGPGECAWADRGPRGTEIKAGDTNQISGYLNQVANLPAGKFMEIGVYRDATANNDMVVTQIVGLVSPPFSSSPTLP